MSIKAVSDIAPVNEMILAMMPGRAMATKLLRDIYHRFLAMSRVAKK